MYGDWKFLPSLTGMFMGMIMPISNTIITLAVPEEKEGNRIWHYHQSGPVGQRSRAGILWSPGYEIWLRICILEYSVHFLFVTLLIRLQHKKVREAQARA